VELSKWRLVASCCAVISAWMLPTRGQAASELTTPEVTTAEVAIPEVTAAAGAAAGWVRTQPLAGQEFHCHTGYPVAQCEEDIARLKKVLAHYPTEGLGQWTWVLVRSEDWKPISRKLRLDPDSPAFTALDPRETFLEEALFLHNGMRIAELMNKWQQSMPKLLELAVTHELGHALCEEPNEAAADRFGAELRNGRLAPCRGRKF
jgi:hypothetical protein